LYHRLAYAVYDRRHIYNLLFVYNLVILLQSSFNVKRYQTFSQNILMVYKSYLFLFKSLWNGKIWLLNFQFVLSLNFFKVSTPKFKTLSVVWNQWNQGMFSNFSFIVIFYWILFFNCIFEHYIFYRNNKKTTAIVIRKWWRVN
jgi:hypothetical protein